MNRTPSITAAVSPTGLQKGLFVLFAVLVTLLGCQAYERLAPAATPLPLHFQIPPMASNQFSPVSRVQEARGVVLEQTAEVNAPAVQQRWTF
jgi:hypothetical protein